MKEITKDSIKNFLEGFSNVIDAENVELYKSLVDKKCFDKITDFEEFRLGLIYPHEQFISGFVKTQISNNRDVAFLYQNSDDIANHFRYWIERIEGMSCCADKTRTIIRRLINFFDKGERIEFDYNQEYTFHLPKIVFTTHESIVAFYESLKVLRSGNPSLYLEQLKSITQIKS